MMTHERLAEIKNKLCEFYDPRGYLNDLIVEADRARAAESLGNQQIEMLRRINDEVLRLKNEALRDLKQSRERVTLLESDQRPSRKVCPDCGEEMRYPHPDCGGERRRGP